MNIIWKNLALKEVAQIISGYLIKNSIHTTLVGGACVSIYSKNKYQSYDLDFVSDSSLIDIQGVLNVIGFKRKGRLFEHPECQFILDFVAPPLSIGNEPVKETNIIKSKYGTLNLITPTDCIKDRLAAFFYWNDYQSLEQAVLVAQSNKSKINFNKIKKWSNNENHKDKYNAFLRELKMQRK